jgi:hypothetical protein
MMMYNDMDIDWDARAPPRPISVDEYDPDLD